jgi:lipoprotein-anchoring transpeptidase ErfK/SrfK
MRSIRQFTLVAGALLLGACTVSDASRDQAADTARAAAPAAVSPAPATQSVQPATSDSASAGASAPAPSSTSTLRVEVDLGARKLYLYDADKRVETHSVAVGSSKWPTQTGEWKITQVVFNPEWIPPDETWAEERDPKKPGAPDNPLGRAQLVYDPPRTVHGTNQPSSIGKAVSHGSIRMRNAEIVARIMEASGAGKDAAWYRRAAEQRTEKQVVDLPTPVPIRVF